MVNKVIFFIRFKVGYKLIIEGVNFKFWNFIVVYIMCLKEERFRKFKFNIKWILFYINLVNLIGSMNFIEFMINIYI